MCVGGRKSQLKASMLTIDTGIANGSPQSAATGQDGEEVEDAEAQDRGDRLERPDRDAHDRDRREAEQRGHQLSKQPVPIAKESLRPKRAHEPRIRPGPNKA